MLKSVFIISLLFVSIISTATEENLDVKLNVDGLKKVLENQSFAADKLLPKGYVQSAEAKGDLNNDGVSDIALLIKPELKKSKNKKEDSDDDSYDLPQAVLIFLGDKSGHYTFWKLGATHFINSDPILMDANGIGSFEITKGVLKLTTSVARSMGGWSAGGCTMRWRNSPAGFQLIGLTIEDIDRKCACGKTTDINYLSGQQIVTSDMSKDGQQLSKSKVAKSKSKLAPVYWENFNYEKLCSNE